MRQILIAAMLVLSSQSILAQAPNSAGAKDREKVLGIGGVFVRARDRAALARWYETHLGITQTPTSYDAEPWVQEAGPTVFAPFATTTKYFDRPEQQWMLNFRVRDMDAMVRQLRDGGIEVKVDSVRYPNGRFARLHDPEGNPIELWEEAKPGTR